MPNPWSPSSVGHNDTGRGVYQIMIHAPGSKAVDVTYLREVPTAISTYTSADPFGDSTAQIQFPQVTIFDDIGSGELDFLQDFADVTIYLVWWPPGQTYDSVKDLPPGATLNSYRVPVWEGYIASMDWHQDATTSTLTLQCQGACFQVDKYLAKPMFPPRPIPYETLIQECFSHKRHPNLRTAPLKIEFPSGWTTLAPNYANTPSYLTPVGVTPGEKITGYFSRNTGAWEKSLTTFIQTLLNSMYDPKGQQWTIRMDPGRKPVLCVRQMFNLTPDYVIAAGTPGVDIDLSRDLTQYANVLYGQGTDASGTEWDRAEVSSNGRETDYAPLSYDPEIYPLVDNDRFNSRKMTVEAYTKYDNGFDERQALDSAKQMLSRDMDPGLSGTLTLRVDPEGSIKGLIRAGQSILVKYVVGSGTTGVLFHIAEADHSPMDGTVTLKIDTKFRDLLTLEEVLVRTRDPLTPVKMLQINKRSILVPDQLAPWNYKKGSGFIPNKTAFFKDVPATEKFSYKEHSLKYPPKKHPHMYVRCHANAKTRKNRWVTVPIRMAEKGDIRLTQIAAFDEHGNLLKVPFHFSVYYTHVSADDMPRDGLGPSPFIPGAFESTNAAGEVIDEGTPGATMLPSNKLIIGWGNGQQPAGYSPGAKSAGDPVTGMLVDGTSWSFDCTNNPDFNRNLASGAREPESAITVYGIFYCEYKDYVYFRGRFYRAEPGTT